MKNFMEISLKENILIVEHLMVLLIPDLKFLNIYKKFFMKICMIGTGYVGLVSGTCFADLGNKVYCVDKDKIKINKLKNAISPIYEPGLDDLIKNNFRAKRLDFTDDLEKAIKESQVIFICVGTPTKKGSNLS